MKQSIALLMCIVAFISGCKQQAARKDIKDTDLTITVKNITPRTLYAACFAHMKTKHSPRWRWHKSEVATLKPGVEQEIHIGTLSDKKDLMDIYGSLAVFTQKHDADKAIYELLPDHNKLDLDRIGSIGAKTIIVGVEKYGITGDIFDYDFVPLEGIEDVEELDFVVENQTGRDIYATAFVYQIKEDMPTWRYDKTPVVFIRKGGTEVIDVDTLIKKYDRKYMRGYLAVFDGTEKEDAYKSTYQLLKPHQKLKLGRLSALQDKKVIINDQKYGIMGDMIDFTIKKPRKISFGQKTA